MPPIESQNLNQHAVLWVRGDYDTYGRYTVSSPIEINVRWEEGQTQSSGAQDTVIAVSVTLFVDRVITPGSLVWKGKLKDLPASPTNIKEVENYDEVPDLKGRRFRRRVTCKRYEEQLPTVV